MNTSNGLTAGLNNPLRLAALSPSNSGISVHSSNSLRRRTYPYDVRKPRPVIIPRNGGIARKWCMRTVPAMVTRNRITMKYPPFFTCTASIFTDGFSPEIVTEINAAGTSQLMREGTNSAKKSPNSTTPYCQTISVVMSPKGLNVPPALAATTTLMQAAAMNRPLLAPIAMTTAPITSAVVKLSATGEMKNASMPVSQNTAWRDNPLEIKRARKASKMLRSLIVLMNVMADSRNNSSSAYSSRLCRRISATAWDCSWETYAIAVRIQIAPAATMTGFDFRR